MKKLVIIIVFCITGLSLFAQANEFIRRVPGAVGQLGSLLNKPTMVKPANADPLGRNWFRLETDVHVFTNEVSVRQVAAVLGDLDNQDKYFSGKKSRLTAKIVSRGNNETIVDWVSTSVGPLSIQIRTPYRASVRVLENTGIRYVIELNQVQQDNDSNKDIKRLYAARFAEEVIIDDKKYTYIRVYTIEEVNASILPGAKGTLERMSGPLNEEILEMLIAAAKLK
jgi:hypothetical protein